MGNNTKPTQGDPLTKEQLEDLERRLIATLMEIWRVQGKRKKIINLVPS